MGQIWLPELEMPTKRVGFHTEEASDGTYSSVCTSNGFSINASEYEVDFIFGSTELQQGFDHSQFMFALYKLLTSGVLPVIRVAKGFGSREHEQELVKLLRPYRSLIVPGDNSGHESSFSWEEFIELGVPRMKIEHSEKMSGFYLKTLTATAAYTSEGEKANYTIDLEAMCNISNSLLKVKLPQEQFPKKVYGYIARPPSRKTLLFEQPIYTRAIVQHNGSAFTYNNIMENLAAQLVKDSVTPYEKSKAIHAWVSNNIEYDTPDQPGKEREKHIRHRGALQTFQEKKGVCGESAVLQITLERLVGNRAFLVHLDEGTKGATTDGKNISLKGGHAIAAHMGIDGKLILVDTTRKNGFDIDYEEYLLVTDEEACCGYN